jgi:acetyl esterase/lipase
VTYCMQNGVPVKMDIYYPKAASGQWPVAMIIHGGAWIWGDKVTSASLAIQPGLTERGFLVVSINYRLGPSFPWPSMIEDAKCAVRYLRAHAGDYNLDPNRIGAVGDSVGGQIALLLGLTDSSVGWDVGEYLDYSSQVQAVVDFFGPTNLTDPSVYDLMVKRGISAFYNIGWNSPELIKASPITYAKKDAPPIFIAHGNLDLTVRLVQSQMFYDKMNALSAPIWLVVMKNGIHSFAPVYYQVSPSYEEVYSMAVNFLANKLASLPCQCSLQSTKQPADESGSDCFMNC